MGAKEDPPDTIEEIQEMETQVGLDYVITGANITWLYWLLSQVAMYR